MWTILEREINTDSVRGTLIPNPIWVLLQMRLNELTGNSH